MLDITGGSVTIPLEVRTYPTTRLEVYKYPDRFIAVVVYDYSDTGKFLWEDCYCIFRRRYKNRAECIKHLLVDLKAFFKERITIYPDDLKLLYWLRE